MKASASIGLATTLLAIAACGADPARPDDKPRIVARLVIDPSPAKAVHLEVTGPGTGEFDVEKAGIVADDWQGPTALALVLFGNDLSGPIGAFPKVDPEGPRLEQVRVLDAVGADNLPLPPGTVTARVVIDTIR